MNDIVLLMLSLAGGMALGAFYFMSLWRNVKNVTGGAGMSLRFVLEYFIRTAVVLAGFYIIMSGRWERMAIALFGFIVMREIIKHIIKRQKEPA